MDQESDLDYLREQKSLLVYDKREYAGAYYKAISDFLENQTPEGLALFDTRLGEIMKDAGEFSNIEEQNRHAELRSIADKLIARAELDNAYEIALEKPWTGTDVERRARILEDQASDKSLKQEEFFDALLEYNVSHRDIAWSAANATPAPPDFGYNNGASSILPAEPLQQLDAESQSYLDKDYPSQINAQWDNLNVEPGVQRVMQSADGIVQSGNKLVQEAGKQSENFFANRLGDAEAFQKKLTSQISQANVQHLRQLLESQGEQMSILEEASAKELAIEERKQELLAILRSSGVDGPVNAGGLFGGGTAGFVGGEDSGAGGQFGAGFGGSPFDQAQIEMSAWDRIGQARGNLQSGNGGFGDIMTGSLGSLVDNYTNVANELSGIWGDFFVGFGQGFADSVGQAIVYGDSLGDSLGNVARQISSDLISSLVQLGIQWVVMQGLGSTMAASSVATMGPVAGALSSMWAGPAALASLASFGSNAGPAIAGMTSAMTAGQAMSMAGMLGFADGGYTGSLGRKEIAGVVHGQEFVFDAPAVDRLGVGTLEALRSGRSGRGLGDYGGSSGFGGSGSSSYPAGYAADYLGGYPGFSTMPGASGAGAANINVSIENYGSSKEFEVQRLSPEDVRIIARDVVRAETPRLVSREIANPNSDISKGFERSTRLERRR